MTQKSLVKLYLTEHSEITPAKMGGKVFHGTMFGSEIGRVCRQLRTDGYLMSIRRGKFETFFLADREKESTHDSSITKENKTSQDRELGFIWGNSNKDEVCNPYNNR